ncbi:hypothetical protein Taro_045808 [Colocasia esculenta]|uniref:DEAD/DEAH box helicase domain-containing protein n=1 Tax=Colocasia esculenta TaxID=4460 RepID=A0A843WXG8_COLES|nr:hypothetical protein [Colocasia esculenta]
MAKGDDAVMRKRGRAQRKKNRSLQSKESVSARVAAIIASKRRRKCGKRRICEAMCFSLPTPEDPFNDLNDPKAKKEQTSQGNADAHKKKRRREEVACASPWLTKCSRKSDDNHLGQQPVGKYKCGGDGDSEACLSKYLILCLKSIEDSWSQDSKVEEDGFLDQESVRGQRPPLLACTWGIDFWRSCSSGLDIVDSNGPCASQEQVAWLVSAACDMIAKKEKEGFLVSSPFLVFLVPSQEKATEIRSVCKPLKSLGVHTVSLHRGASLDHQVRGLKSCEPEFIVSTPERLLDLVTLKALDISGVSLLCLWSRGIPSVTIISVGKS